MQFGKFVMSNTFQGIHIALFCIYLFVLFAKKKAVQLAILLALTVMFALATADVGLSFHIALHDLPSFNRAEINVPTFTKRIFPKAPIFVTNKYVLKFLWHWHSAKVDDDWYLLSLIADMLLVCV